MSIQLESNLSIPDAHCGQPKALTMNDTLETLPDYKDNAEAYELEQTSRPDEMAMIFKAAAITNEIVNTSVDINVLDFCCGTGLSFEGLVDNPNISSIVGVDISDNFLSFAKEKYSKFETKVSFVKGDVILTPLPERKWDIIMMCSAYHHVEDLRKVDFLTRVSNLLKNDGVGIIAENILPAYQSAEGYKKSVQLFYKNVLATAKLKNPNLSKEVEGLIKKVAEYGCDGDYEYKVSMNVFKAHLEEAGLFIVDEFKVWPEANMSMPKDSGNFVFIVKSKNI